MKNLLAYRPADRIRLVNGRFVDVENGCIFAPQVSVIIQHRKIVAMPGLPGEPPDFPADLTIDLQGKTVIPGLFNTHCHLQLLSGVMNKGELRQRQIAKNLADCIDRGITNIRDTLCYDLRQNRYWSEKIGRGEIPGPRIHQAIHVAPLGGTYSPRQTLQKRWLYAFIGMALVDYRLKESGVVAFRPDATVQEARQAVDRAIDERGAAAIKFCDQPEHFLTYKSGAAVITQEQLEAAVDQASRRGLPTTIHNVTLSGFRQSIKAGISSLAHLPIDDRLTEEDVIALLDARVFIEPTLSVGYYMSYSMKGSPWYGHPVIQRLDGFREASYDGVMEESWLPELHKAQKGQHEALRTGQLKVGFLDMSAPFRFYAKLIPVGAENLRLMYEHGAKERFGCGSDATVSNCSQASIHLELELFDFLLNQNGARSFDGATALRTASLQSAQAIGVEKEFGSIHPGKIADLAVIDGDPLEDFRRIGRPVQALFMDGQVLINRCGLKVDGA